MIRYGIISCVEKRKKKNFELPETIEKSFSFAKLICSRYHLVLKRELSSVSLLFRPPIIPRSENQFFFSFFQTLISDSGAVCNEIQLVYKLLL